MEFENIQITQKKASQRIEVPIMEETVLNVTISIIILNIHFNEVQFINLCLYESVSKWCSWYSQSGLTPKHIFIANTFLRHPSIWVSGDLNHQPWTERPAWEIWKSETPSLPSNKRNPKRPQKPTASSHTRAWSLSFGLTLLTALVGDLKVCILNTGDLNMEISLSQVQRTGTPPELLLA